MSNGSDAGPSSASATFDDNPPQKPGWVTRALVRVSGVDVRDVRDSPGEMTRYAVYGFAVIITSSLALFTMPIALAIAIGGFRWIMAVIALVWAAFIFNIDRWIITVVDHKSLTSAIKTTVGEWISFLGRKLGLFVVRLTLAGLIALSIAEPLLLVVFNHEVQSEIATIHQHSIDKANQDVEQDSAGKYMKELNEYARKVAAAKKGQSDAQTADTNATKTWKTALGKYNCETSPETAVCTPDLKVGTTGQVGCKGEACDQLKKDLDRAAANKKTEDDALQAAIKITQTAQNNLLIKQDLQTKPKTFHDTTIAEEKAQDKKTAIANLPSTKGFSIREQALSAAADHDATTRITIWLVRALLLMFELTPIVLKTFSPPTVYEQRARFRAVRSFLAAQKAFESHIEADARVVQKRVGIAAAREIRKLDVADQTSALEAELAVTLESERLHRQHDIAVRRLVADHARAVADIDAVDAGMFGDGMGQGAGPNNDHVPGSDAPGESAGAPKPGADDGPDSSEPAGDGGPGGAAGGDDVGDSQPAEEGDEDIPTQPYPAGAEPVAWPPTAIPGELIGGRWRFVRFLDGADRGMAVAIMLVVDAEEVYPGLSVLKRTKVGHDLNIPVGDLSPFVAPVLDKGQDRDCFYVVTPYYQAGSLQRRLNDGRAVVLGKAVQYIRETLTGLRDVWDGTDVRGARYQLLHLDIKPANLMIDDLGHIRIIDWGLSSFESDKHHIPSSAAIRFTEWYAPPEQVLRGSPGWPGRGWRSPWADIRSVGAVFYEMFTGYWPLWCEAKWADVLGPDGLLPTNDVRKLEGFFNLLAAQEPVPMLEFAPHLPAKTCRSLEPLQHVISTWLKPDRGERTGGEPAEPAIALRMLASAVANIADEDLGGLPIGQRGGMQEPPPRQFGRDEEGPDDAA